MRISFEAPEEWKSKLDDEARKDGHSNRAAIIRKIVNLYFAGKLSFVSENNENKDNSSKAAQEASAK